MASLLSIASSVGESNVAVATISDLLALGVKNGVSSTAQETATALLSLANVVGTSQAAMARLQGALSIGSSAGIAEAVQATIGNQVLQVSVHASSTMAGALSWSSLLVIPIGAGILLAVPVYLKLKDTTVKGLSVMYLVSDLETRETVKGLGAVRTVKDIV